MKKKKDDGQTSYVLMFDGKTVKRVGDVNLLGHEKGKSVTERKRERDDSLYTLDIAIKTVKYLLLKCTHICDTRLEYRSDIKEKLISVIKIISSLLQQLRELKKSKSLNLSRLKEKGGDDWRGSKYLFAIYSCMTILYRLENAITKSLTVQWCLCKVVATLNEEGELFAKSDRVDLSCQKNVKLLKDPQEIKFALGTSKIETSITKQRTDEWYEARKDMKVTGSTMYSAIGCDGLKKQREHFDKVFSKVSQNDTTSEQNAAMKHGIESEIHEIATLSSIIMPVYSPGHVFYEEGYYIKDGILVSPDGSIRLSETPIYAFEGKAPVGNTFTTPVHYKIPERYITQTLFEQKVLNSKGTIYTSWSKESTTVFLIPPNDKICDRVLGEIETVNRSAVPKRPTMAQRK